MRRVGRIIWTALGAITTLNFAVYGIWYACAWVGIAEIPEPALSTRALAFIGAAALMAGMTFPSLGLRVDG